MKNHPVICIMGPTGCGKTKLAIKLVQKFPVEIISVDSSMVYREMDIGTAKPTAEELAIAPHRLINICDPSESYSAAKFRKDALQEIEKIFANNKIPLLVGGTMLYFKAVIYGLSKLPAANQELRDKLQLEVAEHGLDLLYKKLQGIDPASAARIKPNDFQRVQRALEVYELTGKTMSELFIENKAYSLPYKTLNIGLIPFDRALLHERLAMRFHKMLKDGLVAEVEHLYNRGDLSPDLPSMRSVGYRQVWQYLEGKLTYDEMTEKAIIATRQLAKRQLTWLRTWPDLTTFDCETVSSLGDTL